MEASEFRLILIVAGALILAAVYWFGRSRTPRQAAVHLFRDAPDRRQEPRFGHAGAEGQAEFDPHEIEIPSLSDDSVSDTHERDASQRDARHRDASARDPDVRLNPQFDKVVTLHVMAPDDGLINGAELVVAAEKASLVHHGGLFHRLLDGRTEPTPVFSVINRVRPGHFDVSDLPALKTPGISLFMTLPGPLSALDAWDKMLPAAQRLAELLHAQVFDAEMNALGRQRIASLRDELRAFDRKQESREIRPRW